MLLISNYTNPQIKSISEFLEKQLDITKKHQIFVENMFLFYKNNTLMEKVIYDIRNRIELISFFSKELNDFTKNLTELDTSCLNDFIVMFRFEELNKLQSYIYSNNWNIQNFNPNQLNYLNPIELILDWPPKLPIPADFKFNFINVANKHVTVDAKLGQYTFTGVGTSTKLFKRKSISGTLNCPIENILSADMYLYNFKYGYIHFLSNSIVIGEFNFPPDIVYNGTGNCFIKDTK